MKIRTHKRQIIKIKKTAKNIKSNGAQNITELKPGTINYMDQIKKGKIDLKIRQAVLR